MTDNLHTLIIDAARLRADGASWALVGQHARRSAETCRQWPRRYPKIWSAETADPADESSSAKPPRSPPKKRARNPNRSRKVDPALRDGSRRPDPSRSAGSTLRNRGDDLPILVDVPVPSINLRQCDPNRGSAQSSMPSRSSTSMPAWFENQLRANPEALPKLLDRLRARQHAAMNPPPALPLPIAPAGKPAPTAQPLPPPQRHQPPPYRISSANLVMAFITAISLGWAIAASMPGYGQPAQQRVNSNPHSETMLPAFVGRDSAPSINSQRRFVVNDRAPARRAIDPEESESMAKYVYFFGGKSADGNGKMKELLGGKGANLAEMCLIGLPVPAGFTITTEVCTWYYANKHTYPAELKAEVDAAFRKTEEVMGAKFGDSKNPLLVSCRSGARVSMPGMMDTVLNIGLNEGTLKGLIDKTKNERFAWDSYRRFVQMYGDVVLDMKPAAKTEIDPFEKIMEELKHEKGVHLDTELNVKDLQELVKRFKKVVKEKKGKDFPDDPMEQVWGAIAAVFASWNNDRAIVYRRQYGYPHDWGTAVNICSMVFGNMGDDSATGVAFTRDPATGENVFYGEYLINAQGEDVVAGIRTPKKIAELAKDMPPSHKQLLEVRQILEKHYRDVQDIEFTIQQGKLWMLQTRNGKRTGFAGVRFAVDMVDEGLITKEEALSAGRVPPDDLNQLLQPIFDPEAKRKAKVIAKGINAGPGAATGIIKFFADDAEAHVNKHGKPDAHGKRDPNGRVILVRRETSPEDIRGMQAADGILTAFGGASSHAALVSRQMGKVCIVGCSALQIDYDKRTVKVGDLVLKEGDFMSIDGFTGEVMSGQVATKASEVVQVLIDKTMKPEQSRVYKQFAELMQWADEKRKLRIRTNADKPDQAAQAIAFGAEGIGLCRTEHMFFDHIVPMREMILAETHEGRQKALAKLLPFQRADFEGIFRAMKGMPVTIRTLDPPLHEFVPHDAKGQEEMARQMGVSKDVIAARVKSLHEFNPMLGFRGCRLGIVYPEITEMQARAIFEAACNVQKEGIRVEPEVMIPLVGYPTELKSQAKIVRETAEKVFAEKGVKVTYLVGTMIELPRACVAADQIAREAEFFSFGTNDLTQTGLGMSRDDYGTFIRVYTESDIVPKDPFQVIDFDGVGGLMQIGVERGRKTRPDLKIGICGEHGGEPDSVKFCHKIGLNYVSCSPFRVPIARLAAAQAALGK